MDNFKRRTFVGIKELELEIRNVKMKLKNAKGVIEPVQLTEALILLQDSLIKLLSDKRVETDNQRKAA